MVRTGFFFAAVPGMLAVLLGWHSWWWAASIFLLLAGFMLLFFRDPERKIPSLPGAIVAPADGRVLSIEQASLDGQPAIKVSIFLSIWDVHVNRTPVSGIIAEVRYRPGKFRVASHERASRENEHNEVVVAGDGQRVVFRQIAGILARRIEFWKKVGDRVERGERVGMIRFGSRTEVLFDARYVVQVRPGEHLRAGSSVLAVQS